jgi:hypothetical protein
MNVILDDVAFETTGQDIGTTKAMNIDLDSGTFTVTGQNITEVR